MLQEVRRFAARDDAGRSFEVVEVVMVIGHEGATLEDGVRTFFLATGCEAIPTNRSGEYRVPRKGIVVRDASKM